VIVAVSKSGRAPELLRVLEIAMQQGATVVAITSSNTPLAKRATVALETDHIEIRESQMSMISRILHLVMIDILAVGVAIRRALPNASADVSEAMVKVREAGDDDTGAVLDWLSHGNVPKGLICMNDRAAVGAYQALRDRGLAIPDDVSVVSFDGSAVASWLRPQAVSIILPLRTMGALAVELLLGGPDHRGSGPDGDPEHGGVHLVPMPVLAGDSVRTVEQGHDA
jgi:hypothetical protein